MLVFFGDMRSAMIFQDRAQAGKRLAEPLRHYGKDVVVVGLTRGGVLVAAEVSKALGAVLDIIVVKKIGAPGNPELAVGAVAEVGRGIFNDDLITLLGVSQEYLKGETERQRELAMQKKELYLRDREEVDYRSKTIILVDDGLATGASMKVAIAACQEKGAEKIVVAVPVAPPDTCHEIGALVDEVVCLERPSSFPAVGAFYKEFDQVTDEEIIRTLAAS
jgi:predicted phosphoribosyltransferase